MNRMVWRYALTDWVQRDTWNSGLPEDEARFEAGVRRAIGAGQSIVDATVFKATVIALAKQFGRELPSDDNLHERFVQAVGISDVISL